MSGSYFNTTMVVTKFEAAHKGQKRNTSKTSFIQDLAAKVRCSPATVYRVLRDAQIQVIRGSMLKTHVEISASAAAGKCGLQKRKSAKPFPDLIVLKLKENKLASVEEQIHWHQNQADPSMITISAKTFCSYVHQGLVGIKPIDLTSVWFAERDKNHMKPIFPGVRRAFLSTRGILQFFKEKNLDIGKEICNRTKRRKERGLSDLTIKNDEVLFDSSNQKQICQTGLYANEPFGQTVWGVIQRYFQNNHL